MQFAKCLYIILIEYVWNAALQVKPVCCSKKRLVTDDIEQLTDEHFCFKSGNIHKTEGGQILPHICDSHIDSMKFDWRNKSLCWSEIISQAACPCLTTTTVLRHVVSRGFHLYHNFYEMWLKKLCRENN